MTVSVGPHSHSADETVHRPAGLSTPRAAFWGGAGGVVWVVFSNGLFDTANIQAMIAGPRPVTQLAAYAVTGLVIATAGIVWTLVHRPIHSIKVAFQLGIIAPAALNAMITANASPVGHDQAANPTSTGSFIERLDEEFLVGPATAAPLPDAIFQEEDPPKPTILDCIKQAIVKRPC